MKLFIDAVVVLVILTNLNLIASSRLAVCIRAVTIQGIILGFLPLIAGSEEIAQMIPLAVATVLLKAVLMPWLLLRALKSTAVRREIDPLVGYSSSLVIGAILLGVAMWLGRQLPLPVAVPSDLVAPLAFFTMFIGLFTTISRRKALTQTLGYLAMENGIYIFGIAFALREPIIVELGILLDALMAVFVMGITIFHIGREFEHMDTDRLSALKD